MKSILVFLCASLCTWSLAAQQNPQPRAIMHPPIRSDIQPSQGGPGALDANYVVKLTMQAEGKTNFTLKVLVARPSFTVSSTQPSLNLSGTLSVQEDGRLVLDYSLTAVHPQEFIGLDGKTSMLANQTAWNASVRLPLDKAVPILSKGGEKYILEVSILKD